MPLRSRKRSAVALFLVSLFLVAPVLGCSDDDTAATAPSPTPPPAASSASLTGTWTGESGSTSAPSILEIEQLGDRVRATVTWPGNDRRELHGRVIGSFVQLSINVDWSQSRGSRTALSGDECYEDLWLLDWDGDTLRGCMLPCLWSIRPEERQPLHFRRQG